MQMLIRYTAHHLPTCDRIIKRSVSSLTICTSEQKAKYRHQRLDYRSVSETQNGPGRFSFPSISQVSSLAAKLSVIFLFLLLRLSLAVKRRTMAPRSLL